MRTGAEEQTQALSTSSRYHAGLATSSQGRHLEWRVNFSKMPETREVQLSGHWEEPEASSGRSELPRLPHSRPPPANIDLYLSRALLRGAHPSDIPRRQVTRGGQVLSQAPELHTLCHLLFLPATPTRTVPQLTVSWLSPQELY